MLLLHENPKEGTVRSVVRISVPLEPALFFVDFLLKSEISLKCFIFPFPPLRLSLSDSFFACQSAGSSRAA